MTSVLRSLDHGDRAPVPAYSTGISDFFPRPKLRVVEGSFIDKDIFEISSINGGVNGEIEGSFVEFRYPGHEKGYLDLSSLVLNIAGSVTKEGGGALEADDKVTLADGFMFTLIKSISVYLNDHQVDLNTVHSYSAYVNMVTAMNPHHRETLGECIGFANKRTPDVITDAHMADSAAETAHLRAHGFHYSAPLTCDIAGSDMYLVSNVSLRIKIEFNSDQFMLNTPTANFRPRLKISRCTLQLTTRTPRPEAHSALMESMLNAPLSYIYPKMLHKNYILPAQQTSLSMDYPFSKVIPETLYIFMVRMPSAAGDYKRNPFYFGHNNIQSLQVYADNKNMCDIKCSFPGKCTNFYYNTLASLGAETFHGLTKDLFMNGRTIAVISLEPEKLSDVVAIEKDGNLRLSMQLARPADENIVVYILGTTTAVYYIDKDSNVYTDTR